MYDDSVGHGYDQSNPYDYDSDFVRSYRDPIRSDVATQIKKKWDDDYFRKRDTGQYWQQRRLRKGAIYTARKNRKKEIEGFERQFKGKAIT